MPLVEDRLERHKDSFLGRTRWYRTASCPEGSLSTLEPALGSMMPGAYDGDEGAILIGSTPAVTKTAGQVRISLVYERLDEGIDPGLSVPSNWTFLERSPGYRYRGDKYRGLFVSESLETPNGLSDAAVLGAVPYGTVYPGQEGLFAPVMRRYTFRNGFRPGRGSLVFDWDPPTLEEVLLEHTDHVRVEARSVNFAHRPFKDLKGNYVWHQERDPSGGPSYKWEPVAGSGIRHDRRMQFRTRFAKAYGIGGLLLGYQNTLNGVTMQQYWNCPTGTLRFAAWTRYRAPTIKKLWIYECFMEYHPDGWNEETEIQEYEYRAFKIRVRDAEGVLLDPAEHRIVSDWFPTGDPYFAELYEKMQWPMVLGTFDW